MVLVKKCAGAGVGSEDFGDTGRFLNIVKWPLRRLGSNGAAMLGA
jgi:hypothetical protein